MRKGIPKTTSRLTLATRKVFLKNLTRLAWFLTEKAATTIPKVSSVVPSIFYAPMSVGLMKSPNSWIKVEWTVLILLPESKSAKMGTNFFQKMMEYQMHKTYARFSGYSLLLFSSTLPAPAASAIFSLVSVTSGKVAKTDTSFLAPFSDFGDTCLSNISSNGRWSTRLGKYLSSLSRLFWWCGCLYILQKVVVATTLATLAP